MQGLIVPALGLREVGGDAAARQGAGRVVKLAHKKHGFGVAFLRSVFQQQKCGVAFLRLGIGLAQGFCHGKAHVGQCLPAQLLTRRGQRRKRLLGGIRTLLPGICGLGLGLIRVLGLVRILRLLRGRGQGGFFRLAQQEPPRGNACGNGCKHEQEHKPGLGAGFAFFLACHFKRSFLLLGRLRLLKSQRRLRRFQHWFRLRLGSGRRDRRGSQRSASAHAVPASDIGIYKRFYGKGTTAHAAQADTVGIEVVHLVHHRRANGQPQAAAVIVPGIGGEQGFALLPAAGAKAFAVRCPQQGKAGLAHIACVKNLDDSVAGAAPGIG